MRIRIRGPEGASTLTLQDEATVADLREEITNQTRILCFDVKYGYPPKSLGLAQRDGSELLCKLGVKLDGEQLTITPREPLNQSSGGSPNDLARIMSTGNLEYPAKSLVEKGTLSSSRHFESPNNPVSLSARNIGDVPQLPLPSRGATVGKYIITV